MSCAVDDAGPHRAPTVGDPRDPFAAVGAAVSATARGGGQGRKQRPGGEGSVYRGGRRREPSGITATV